MKRIALAAFLFVTLVLSAAEPAPTLRRNTVDEVIAAMTPEEKVLMVIGNKNNDRRRYIGEGSTWYCARLGLMPTVMCDGPARSAQKPFGTATLPNLLQHRFPHSHRAGRYVEYRIGGDGR